MMKIAIFVTIILCLFWACSEPTEMNTVETREERPDQESWNVIITMTDEGLKRVTVRADHLEKFNNRLLILLEDNVIADFYDAYENPKTILHSDKAEIDESANYMQAIDNVVVKSDSGITLYTSSLAWDHEAESIYTEDSVMITTEQNDTLYGIGFESDLQLNHWKILKPSGVTGRIDE